MITTKIIIAGISTVTCNGNGACEDIPKLWKSFFEQEVSSQVVEKVNNNIYAVYSDYEGDQNAPFTLTIGYQVNSVDDVPEGLEYKIIEAQNYQKFIAEGDITSKENNPIFTAWSEIWEMPLERTFTTDYEMYPENTNPQDAKVEIAIGVK